MKVIVEAAAALAGTHPELAKRLVHEATASRYAKKLPALAAQAYKQFKQGAVDPELTRRAFSTVGDAVEAAALLSGELEGPGDDYVRKGMKAARAVRDWSENAVMDDSTKRKVAKHLKEAAESADDVWRAYRRDVPFAYYLGDVVDQYRSALNAMAADSRVDTLLVDLSADLLTLGAEHE